MCPRITPDFSEAASFEPVPPGTYNVRIIGCDSKTNAETGSQRLLWKLETFGADKTELNNRKLMHSTPITGKGAGILKTFIKAATGAEPTGEFETDELLGKSLRVTVVQGKDWKTGEPNDWPEVKAVASLK